MAMVLKAIGLNSTGRLNGWMTRVGLWFLRRRVSQARRAGGLAERPSGRARDDSACASCPSVAATFTSPDRGIPRPPRRRSARLKGTMRSSISAAVIHCQASNSWSWAVMSMSASRPVKASANQRCAWPRQRPFQWAGRSLLAARRRSATWRSRAAAAPWWCRPLPTVRGRPPRPASRRRRRRLAASARHRVAHRVAGAPADEDPSVGRDQHQADIAAVEHRSRRLASSPPPSYGGGREGESLTEDLGRTKIMICNDRAAPPGPSPSRPPPYDGGGGWHRP